MALAQSAAAGWSKRVRLQDGPEGYAYTPGRFLAPDDTETRRAIEAIVPGARRRDLDPDGSVSVPQRTPTSLADVRFAVWESGGDARSAVRRLRGAGLRWAGPSHVFFLDGGPPDGSPTHPLQANPVYANPVYANPVYANPVYANPVYANPVYANPVYANPVYANPVYANPVYANPVYANPVYANPVYANPIEAAAAADALRMRSKVYPSPVYALQRLTDPEAAARYRATGGRRSQAVPAAVDEALASGHGIDAYHAGNVWRDAPVRVAVLDSGFIADVPGDPPTEYVDTFDADGDGDLDPVAGHGSFIAGLIHRVAPGAATIVRRVFGGAGDGDEADVVAAIDAVCNPATGPRPHLLNLSFSGYALDSPFALEGAIQRAIRAGVVVVASAGNDGVDRPAYPAAFDGVIAVAALGPSGPAPFSNHGPWVDACAPGTDVTSWFFAGDGRRRAAGGYDPDRYERWATWSGTSFAAPVVVGAIARAMLAQGIDAADAAAVVIDQPGLLRLPGYGTVVNTLGATPGLVW